MAQTAGVLNGTDLRIWVGGSAVAYATNCTFDATVETRNTIHKDAPGSGWQENTPGQKSFTLSTDVLMNEDGTANDPYDLFTILSAGTRVTWYFSTETAGNRRMYGHAYVTSMNISAAVEENATFSVSFTGTGEPRYATIT